MKRIIINIFIGLIFLTGLSVLLYPTVSDYINELHSSRAIASYDYLGSSLPIGGESTHAILTGHRGLPSAKLFTDLDRLEEGDTFYIKVLGEILEYQIDQIEQHPRRRRSRKGQNSRRRRPD